MGLLGTGALVFVAGVLFGLFGAGGSILLVPILVYVLGLPVKSALGTSLLILTVTGTVAALAHARSRNVSWWIGLRWAALGIVAAYAGGRVAEFIPERVLLTMFATVVVVASLAMMRRRPLPTPVDPRSIPVGKVVAVGAALGIVAAYAGGRVAEFIPERVLLTLFATVVVVASLAMMRRRPLPTPVDPRSIPVGKVVAVGAALGFFTGVMGVGGGFLLVPALVLLCGIDVKLAVGTSLLVIAINSLGGFLGFAAHEAFPWRITLTVAAFNAAGSLVGERIGKRVGGRRLRPAFGVFLLFVGVAMVLQNLLHFASRTR